MSVISIGTMIKHDPCLINPNHGKMIKAYDHASDGKRVVSPPLDDTDP